MPAENSSPSTRKSSPDAALGDFEHIPAALMINAAPEADAGLWGAIGGMAFKFWHGNNIDNITELAGGVDKLGLDVEMIKKLILAVLEFVERQVGPLTMQILEHLLRPQ